MKDNLQKELLSLQIQMKRIMMYKMAKRNGFTHPDVIACSQDLDKLLNRYQKIA
ncbi:aspartyl-phosphate phosphatase Spo0E family protein [Sporosarcina cyprini]|uniref:aspartyl-phosphate phosphatase Spo0E family protein n=1 Tax=Sporosarcina cyprini TaxID=2910523 RepID=UPI001EDDC105|nr:aspartyl-phosphate phosphatase Spo0E family protein [Sporosarcina cyprini]